jgi:hypothetical protein
MPVLGTNYVLSPTKYRSMEIEKLQIAREKHQKATI